MTSIPNRVRAIVTDLLLAEFPVLSQPIPEVDLDAIAKAIQTYNIDEGQVAGDILDSSETEHAAIDALADVYQAYENGSFSCREWQEARREYAMQLTEQAVQAEFHLRREVVLDAIEDARLSLLHLNRLADYLDD